MCNQGGATWIHTGSDGRGLCPDKICLAPKTEAWKGKSKRAMRWKKLVRCFLGFSLDKQIFPSTHTLLSQTFKMFWKWPQTLCCIKLEYHKVWFQRAGLMHRSPSYTEKPWIIYESLWAKSTAQPFQTLLNRLPVSTTWLLLSNVCFGENQLQLPLLHLSLLKPSATVCQKRLNLKVIY